jgi:two-component system response regulator HydG
MPKDKGAEKVLVVDDAPDTLELVRRVLTTEGYTVFTAASVAEGLRLLERTAVDLVITDMRMPEVSGLDLVRHVRENMPDAEVMMITGYASVEGAVEAVKTGAEEYLSKPFTGKELNAAVQRSLEKLRARRQTDHDGGAPLASRHGLLGESEAMQAVYRQIEKAAATEATVLITGESGTGKELVARTIHYESPRAAAPFVPVNCGGIPKDLLESELFGHVKGSFTGATSTRPGFFQTATGGTIFLDEISETSPAMQVRLLRVLQDKEVTMVGSARPERVDVRVVAATNKDLKNLVAKEVFREDLYYRLDVIRVFVPPLRERGDDVLLLAGFFLAKYAAEFGKPTPRLSDEVIEAFKRYDWPGNVRELENAILRLVSMIETNTVDVSDLPSQMRFQLRPGAGLGRKLKEVELEYVVSVLDSVGGNKSRAAKILGIDVKTLREKLKNAKTDDNASETRE